LRGLAEVLTPPPPDQTPTVVVSPTAGDSPTVGELSRADIKPTVGETTTVGVVAPVNDLSAIYKRPTVGDPPTVGVTATEGESATVGDTTTVGVLDRAQRRVASIRDSLTLGEDRVYQILWSAGERDGVVTESASTKILRLGYDRLARLVGLNEKSVRTLLPRMIAKKCIEVVAPENSAARSGRTYRIFGPETALGRQRAAGLHYVVRAGRGVQFVSPTVAAG
jgi:hypothetical protein